MATALLPMLSTLAAFIGALACLCAALLLWSRNQKVSSRAFIIAALGASSALLLAGIAPGIDPRLCWLVETVRNLAFVAVIGSLFAADGRHSSLRPVRPLLFALAVTELAQIPLMALTETFPRQDAVALIAGVAALIRMLFAVGMLVLIHNLFAGAGAEQRTRLGHVATALVLGWGFELNFHTFGYLLGAPPSAMVMLRGVAWTAVATLFYLDGGVRPERRFSPSRSVTFQSLSLIVIALYLLCIFALQAVLANLGVDIGIASQFAAVILAVAVGALLASAGLRAMVRDMLARNLFRHRFDYRAEWLRFSRLIGRDGDGGQLAETLGARAVQALADIVDAPGGLLLEPDEDGGFVLSARWEWAAADVPNRALDPGAVCALGDVAEIVALDDVRADRGHALARIVPVWLIEETRAWALVPLMLEGRLAGAVVLARPAYGRRLDWEDYDLLRIVGQQIAAHLCEHAAQRALMNAARFDEFNRRMAFVMHDIKNLASQLGLTVSNAERHMDNPAFRADMLVTLRNATARMEVLLARLSRYGARGEGAAIAPVEPQALAETLFDVVPFAGRVRVGNGGNLSVLADREGLQQVLRHLVQNAIDASPAGAPIDLRFTRTERQAGIEIADRGHGMSAEFVRNGLFAPFVSTKNDGFGIGAYEARELVRAMGGRVEVVSREGEGTRFTIWLPLHHADDFATLPEERKIA